MLAFLALCWVLKFPILEKLFGRTMAASSEEWLRASVVMALGSLLAAGANEIICQLQPIPIYGPLRAKSAWACSSSFLQPTPFSPSSPAWPVNKKKSMSQPSRHRFRYFSDPICPWCYIGLRRLDRALAELGREVRTTWRCFMLNPDMPDAGHGPPYLSGA